ncbi:hypothetical protein B0H16DRAFT_1881253 [Mycena metata]|uniref:Large ribosomal subunit protein mL59 domain-containing protein n=1 Tax=Mycena metata TaxID=1033252 RepID=A0AAD7JW93_9AGAR|nr:hypothetical protein B0H16DRAFT_1881253 [Mycena metata]
MSAKFLHRELKELPRFIRRHGPLPNPQVANAVVLPNPFLPWRNPKTGRWAPSKYSLRQQADLIKKAKATDTLHLLPPGVKLPQPELFAPPPTRSASAGKAKASASADKAPDSADKTKAKPSSSPKDSTSSGKTGAKANLKGDKAVKGDVRSDVKATAHKALNVTVEWDRRLAVKNIPGADEGTRLYAAKKKMFKGSRLERSIKQRAWRTWVLLHDMRKRIRKYRTYYVHKKPNPLNPSRAAARKLPY